MASGVVGTFRVNRSIFERWSDLGHLHADLQASCAILGLRTGLRFDLSDEQLAAAHTAWKQDMELWLANLLPAKTKELSHLKKTAILLSKLCEFGVVTVSGDGHRTITRRRSLNQDEMLPVPARLPQSEIKKFKDGGCYYVAWLLAYHVCEFFEQRRTDRLDKYESRLTAEFEIDMVSGLLSAKVSAQSIHLILKALFLRD